MLKNVYLDAKIGVDTAENAPSEMVLLIPAGASVYWQPSVDHDGLAFADLGGDKLPEYLPVEILSCQNLVLAILSKFAHIWAILSKKIASDIACFSIFQNMV